MDRTAAEQTIFKEIMLKTGTKVIIVAQAYCLTTAATTSGVLRLYEMISLRVGLNVQISPRHNVIIWAHGKEKRVSAIFFASRDRR